MKILPSILISGALLLGLSITELAYVDNTFDVFHEGLTAIYQKTENSEATHEDGTALQLFWESKKKVLYLWLPHTLIDQVDYHLGEALGYLYQGNYEDSLPKFELLLDMADTIPRAYKILPENIL
jgi:hypothetical protein